MPGARPLWSVLLSAASTSQSSPSTSSPFFFTPRQQGAPASGPGPSRGSSACYHACEVDCGDDSDCSSDVSSESSESLAEESHLESGDESGDESDDEPDDDHARATSTGSGKLWGPEQFPEGTKGPYCWDWSNIQAAQAWECPCEDRPNCIGAERIRPEELLIHRKEICTTLRMNRRDTLRNRLGEHYSTTQRSFSRSFVVGGMHDCCAASSGLAAGVSWSTWSRARADLRKDKPLHAGRSKEREVVESEARRVINAYLRDQVAGMEGSKGGSRGSGKHYTGKQALTQRYQAYRNSRISRKLPVLGSKELFTKCWKALDNVVELAATGMAICDECTEMGVDRDKYANRTDELAVQKMKELEVRAEVHREDHRGDCSLTHAAQHVQH